MDIEILLQGMSQFLLIVYRVETMPQAIERAVFCRGRYLRSRKHLARNLIHHINRLDWQVLC